MLSGEEQKKLDILSNDVFKDKLAKTGYPPSVLTGFHVETLVICKFGFN